MPATDVLRGRQTATRTLTNKSGGSVAQGDVVVIGDGTNDNAFTTTTTASFSSRMVGVAMETIANNAAGLVAIHGYVPLVNSNAGSLTRDRFLFTHTVAKTCTASATRAAGAFGQVLETGTNPEAIVWGMPEASSAAGLQNGTSNPGSPSTNDLFFRTDLGLIIFYNGTRWLSNQLFVAPSVGPLENLSATTDDTGACRAVIPGLLGGSDLWIEQVTIHASNVQSGGTALSASHKWAIAFKKRAVTTGTLTTFGTITIDSGSSGVWRSETAVDVDALMNNGTTHVQFTLTITKTGTPGNLYIYPAVTYRIVVT